MRIAVFALLVAISIQCHAKCRKVEMAVTGRIEDTTGRAVANAIVVVSFIEARQARSELTRTRASGEYSLKFYWDPLSGGGPTRDRCEAKLHYVTVMAVASGYETEEDQVAVVDRKAQSDLQLNKKR